MSPLLRKAEESVWLPEKYLPLYLVLEPTICGDGSLDALLKMVKTAIDHGITAVQLRFEHDPDKGIWYQYALALKELLAPYNVPLIINDHIDVALAVDADGVHIGQSDLPVEITRQLIGPDKILGLSVGNRDELLKTRHDLVDYLGIGPIYPTSTKSDAPDALGVEGLSKLLAISQLPVVAIGGIDATNLIPLLESEMAGISVVSAICGAEDVAKATEALSIPIQAMLTARGIE